MGWGLREQVELYVKVSDLSSSIKWKFYRSSLGKKIPTKTKYYTHRRLVNL